MGSAAAPAPPRGSWLCPSPCRSGAKGLGTRALTAATRRFNGYRMWKGSAPGQPVHLEARRGSGGVRGGKAGSVWHVSAEGLLWVLASLLVRCSVRPWPPTQGAVGLKDGLPGLALTTVLAWASYPPSLTSRCSGQVGQWPPPRARPQPGHSAPTHLLLGLLLGLGVHPAQLVQRLHKHCPHFIDELSDLGTASTGGAAGVWSEARAPLRASQGVAWGWGG